VNTRTRRTRLEPLEGRDAPAALTVSYSAVTHTLTVVGTDGDNQLTIQGDSGDPTHFVLSSTTDTFVGGGTTFASPSGVQNISLRMLAGNDPVTLSNSPPIRLAGALTIDGGDGSNDVFATDLTVGKNLTIRNGTGSDNTQFTNLNVNGSLTLTNGEGETFTQVARTSAGVSTVRGSVTITNGTGTDTNLLNDLNVGGNVTIRNGRNGQNPGYTRIYNTYNTSSQSQIRGSVSVSHLDGNGDLNGDWLLDAEVGGNVAYSYGTGSGTVRFDAHSTALLEVVHGSVSVTGTGALRLRTGLFAGLGLAIGKNLTVTGGAAADSVSLYRATVNGTTSLNLGDGDNKVNIDDSLFVGPFKLTTGGGADTVNLETATGTNTGTTFGRVVTMSLGAGVDSLTLGGSNDANQALVFAGTFIAHHGAEGEPVNKFGKDVYPFGGGLQWVL
jgi:large repetitive protein